MINIKFIFTNKWINIFSIIISIIIFLLIYFLFLNPLNLNSEKNNSNNQISIFSKIIQKNKNKLDSTKNSNNNIVENLENNFWYIEISSISLRAPISEGIDLETLNKYVGHFNDTSLKFGNVGLAAHNRRI